jgi:hypothetical protein
MVSVDVVDTLVENFILYFASDDDERDKLRDASMGYIDVLKRKSLPKGRLTNALKVKYLREASKFLVNIYDDKKKNLGDLYGTIPVYVKEVD